MAKTLTSTIQGQITDKDIKITRLFYINNVNYTSQLISYNYSYDTNFGAASAVFVLDNNDGSFSDSGSASLEVGDAVELIEQFSGDTTKFKKFYGLISQRSIQKRAENKTVTINCLDYLSILQQQDIDLEVEGTRVEVQNEVLTPVYLAVPNDALAQLFNFNNNAIATKPMPLIQFRDKNHTTNIDFQFDGWECYYDVGQLKLGSSLNVRDNYDVLATYSYYVRGKYVEDVIEEILKTADGYGKYLFGESDQDVFINNHLLDTIVNVEGTSIDTLTPNSAPVTLTIETTLTQDFDPGASGGGDTILYLADTTGFPSSSASGETFSINGESFEYTGKDGNSLTGVTGLSAHNSGDYCEYEATYETAQVWATLYDNIQTTLTASDFTIPAPASFKYFDKRFGRLILDQALTIGDTITCNTNYQFKTLQSTGIEINRIVFRKREVANRWAAIQKVKQYLAPNYILRTKGDNKIWGSYLNQKSTADYTLELITGSNYLEDEDLYTRVVMWAKNKEPTNVMFGDDVDYSSDTENSYTGIATKEELAYFGEEKSGVLSDWASAQLSEAELLHQTSTQLLIEYIRDKYINKKYSTDVATGNHIFGTVISDDRGKIILDSVEPTVYINGVPIDNNVHQVSDIPVKIKMTTKTITEGGGKSKSVSVHTYYYYQIIFPHTSISPSNVIYLYDSQGVLRHTIAANDSNVDYANGIWYIPGIERNDVAEILSTATYWVLYDTSKLQIEYDDVIFKIHRNLVPKPEEAIIRATFEYWSIAIGIRDIDAVVDGRRDTQLQLEFFGEPPNNFHLCTIDLGATHTIQAIDIIGGFYRPDDYRKFDIGFKVSMQSSTDGNNFYAISDKTENFSIRGGEAISFEEDDLGIGFTARYLKFNLQEVDRINYGRGRYVIAITELSVYDDIILKSEATLIATTTLTSNVNAGDTTINVDDTSYFTEPESGQTATAYLNKDSTKSFTYTGLTATTFTGCIVESGISASSSQYVTQTTEGDTTLYDNDALLPQLSDRIYHKNLISDRNLFLQDELDDLAKKYLKEFYKNHSKIKVDVLYAPYLEVGQTIDLTDSYNNITNVKYFIERIEDRNGFFSLTLAKYPS